MKSPAGEKALTRDEDDPDAPSHLHVATATPCTDMTVASHMTFPLFDLPAELREMVYAEAITAGTMGLLRTSRSIYREASPLMQKGAIFRIRIQAYCFSYREETIPADLWPSTPIQNVEIGVTIRATRTDDEPHYAGVIDTFTDTPAAVDRDTCYITFKKSILERLHTRPESLLRTVRKLKGFKRIIVSAIATGVWEKDTRGIEAVIRARNKPVYGMALDELEPIFGPGVWHDAATQEGRYLEFCPE